MPDADPKLLKKLKLVTISFLVLYGLGFTIADKKYNDRAKPNLFVIDNAAKVFGNNFSFSESESRLITNYLNELLGDSLVVEKATAVNDVISKMDASLKPSGYKIIFDKAFDEYYSAFEKSTEKHRGTIDVIITILDKNKNFKDFSKKIDSNYLGKSAKEKYKDYLFEKYVQSSKPEEKVMKNIASNKNLFAGNRKFKYIGYRR